MPCSLITKVWGVLMALKEFASFKFLSNRMGKDRLFFLKKDWISFLTPFLFELIPINKNWGNFFCKSIRWIKCEFEHGHFEDRKEITVPLRSFCETDFLKSHLNILFWRRLKASTFFGRLKFFGSEREALTFVRGAIIIKKNKIE